MLRTDLANGALRLTSKEEQISRCLLSNYPVAGLSTVADLADRAGVSVPTVLRFVSKLGFSGYSEFQKRLLEELSDTLNSPLSLAHRVPPEEVGSVYQQRMRAAMSALEKTEADYVSRDFEAVVDLVADERSQIHCLGGRFSTMVSARMAAHLAQLRPGVRHLDIASPTLADQLVDYDSRVTLIAFDFRRYQPETIRFARLAAERRARVILFTDPWQSPISRVADLILTSPVESSSFFDSWIPAIAQTEALVSSVGLRNPDRMRERLAQIEAARAAFVRSDSDGATAEDTGAA